MNCSRELIGCIRFLWLYCAMCNPFTNWVHTVFVLAMCNVESIKCFHKIKLQHACNSQSNGFKWISPLKCFCGPNSFIVTLSVLSYIHCTSSLTIKTQMTNKNVDLGFQGAIVVCAIAQRSCGGPFKPGKCLQVC